MAFAEHHARLSVIVSYYGVDKHLFPAVAKAGGHMAFVEHHARLFKYVWYYGVDKHRFPAVVNAQQVVVLASNIAEAQPKCITR